MRNFKSLLTIAAVALLSFPALATNNTAWQAGSGQGLTNWSAASVAFGTADLTSLASGSAVLSSATAIANGTNLDIYAEISFEVTVSSLTPTAGGSVSIYILPLNADGTTYGDGGLVAGTQKVYVPAYQPVCTINLVAASTNLFAGTCPGPVLLPPDTFKFAVYNGTGQPFSSTAANNGLFFKTFVTQLNH